MKSAGFFAQKIYTEEMSFVSLKLARKRKLSEFDFELDEDPNDKEPSHPDAIEEAGKLIKHIENSDDDYASSETEQDRRFSSLKDTVYERLMDEWRERNLVRFQAQLEAKRAAIKEKNEARRAEEKKIVKKMTAAAAK